jgi:hypothetical protein
MASAGAGLDCRRVATIVMFDSDVVVGATACVVVGDVVASSVVDDDVGVGVVVVVVAIVVFATSPYSTCADCPRCGCLVMWL